MSDRMQEAVRIVVAHAGAGRATVGARLALTVAGYSEAEANEAIRLWREGKKQQRGEG